MVPGQQDSGHPLARRLRRAGGALSPQQLVCRRTPEMTALRVGGVLEKAIESATKANL